nr:avidin/streptavidin family protein [Bradyrhizobium sp. CW1]
MGLKYEETSGTLAARPFLLPFRRGHRTGASCPSYWKNERGSELFVWSANSGAIQGTFTNHAQGFACQGIPYPASGAVSPAGLYFVVTFAQCNSFTRWVGKLNGSQMPTSWTLFYVDKNGKPGKLKGADTFTRVW